MMMYKGLTYGLIGGSLKHSFSQNYFRKKFMSAPRYRGFDYILLEMDDLSKVREIVAIHMLSGFNVTIPFKEEILSYLDEMSVEASKIGAVNTVLITSEGKWVGYNTDAPGFASALGDFHCENALILGTGGASKAVKYALDNRGIHAQWVSRTRRPGIWSYDQITPEILERYLLIVHCTPLGTTPDVQAYPKLPYEALCSNHLLYDLVYNPPETAFLRMGSKYGARTINGYPMLVNQAERAWDIWMSEGAIKGEKQ